MTGFRFGLFSVFLAVLPRMALACEQAICLVDPDSLALRQIVTFDDMPSSFGPGRLVDDVLVTTGVQFGERFAGQSRDALGMFDHITGVPLAPLVAISGGPGETLSITRMSGTNVLNGFGPARYPKRDAQGEGATGPAVTELVLARVRARELREGFRGDQLDVAKRATIGEHHAEADIVGRRGDEAATP